MNTPAVIWEGPPPPEGAEAAVLRDIAELERTGLAHPSDLISHIVFLGEDMDGPGIHLQGRDGTDSYFARYTPKIEWAALDEAADKAGALE